MEEKKNGSTVWRLAADSTAGRLSSRRINTDIVIEEDPSPEVARENIVKEMLRIFDGLMGCTTKRTGVNLAFMHAHKAVPAGGTQKRLEQEIYRLIKGLVGSNSPNTGFAVNLLVNNGTYYYDRSNVPLSFGVFLTSLVQYLEGHDCLSVCPDEMDRLKALLSRG